MATLTGRIANFVSTRLRPLQRWATQRHVKSYRDSGGEKLAEFNGMPVFLLEVVGRRSGEPRPVMLMLVTRGDDLVVVGSNGGNPKAPAWWHNLMAAGTATVQVGSERWDVRARQVDGAERDECWRLAVAAYPDFESYQELTDRHIPVAVLERI